VHRVGSDHSGQEEPSLGKAACQHIIIISYNQLGYRAYVYHRLYLHQLASGDRLAEGWKLQAKMGQTCYSACGMFIAILLDFLK